MSQTLPFICYICNSNMEYYFEKYYKEPPYCVFMEDTGNVCYYKCVNCGFVASKTHYDMTEEKWQKLNEVHHLSEKSLAEKIQNESKDKIGTPPYLQQALMIKVLQEKGIIPMSLILDYAGGYGFLHNILRNYFSIESIIYDPYIHNESQKYILKNDLKKYEIVLNSAMFEHIRKRDDIDSINDFVSENGCLIIHTVVCENIPCDKDWFYIKFPVHCAFHTNKSMEILMEQWKYKSSIYCPTSKCWVLIKNEPQKIREKIIDINPELKDNYFYYKKGFVDYWKGF